MSRRLTWRRITGCHILTLSGNFPRCFKYIKKNTLLPIFQSSKVLVPKFNKRPRHEGWWERKSLNKSPQFNFFKSHFWDFHEIYLKIILVALLLKTSKTLYSKSGMEFPAAPERMQVRSFEKKKGEKNPNFRHPLLVSMPGIWGKAAHNKWWRKKISELIQISKWMENNKLLEQVSKTCCPGNHHWEGLVARIVWSGLQK